MKILLLEDDLRLTDVLNRSLRRSGHVVDLVSRVEDAAWLAAESHYDALVLDVMLPDGDGFSLCARLREEGIWTPVIMLTARDAIPDLVRGLDVGADDYLVKPFVLAELEARLRAVTRRGTTPRPTTIQLGSLRLDPARRTATLGTDALRLTSREFSLLEHFVRRADQVLSRAAIIEGVWDWAFDGDPRIIDVYVRTLRRLLSTDAGAPILATVRGAGYVLRDPVSLPRPALHPLRS